MPCGAVPSLRPYQQSTGHVNTMMCAMSCFITPHELTKACYRSSLLCWLETMSGCAILKSPGSLQTTSGMALAPAECVQQTWYVAGPSLVSCNVAFATSDGVLLFQVSAFRAMQCTVVAGLCCASCTLCMCALNAHCLQKLSVDTYCVI